MKESAITNVKKGPKNIALNTDKAGMEGLDVEKINEIIQKASEGSSYYQHKMKMQERLDEKIEDMKKLAVSFTQEIITKSELQMDTLLAELEAERDLSKVIVHVDMDMFYAAVEMREDPSLRDKPMAVGGPGMLSTSNYAARKFGVRAAMPGFIGKKLCSDLIIVPPNFDKYKEVSCKVQEVFSHYDPNFSAMSLDEAYLDITNYLLENSRDYEHPDFSHAELVVQEMRCKIQEATRLTASAGIASNTRLAKICSDLNKPDGQYYLPSDRDKILEFVSALPIRKVSGIGNVTEQQLSAFGITLCSHLLAQRGLLRLLFSEVSYNSFMEIALGLGHTTLMGWNEKDRKSISTETTFKGTSDPEVLHRIIEKLCQELSEDMRHKDLFGKVFTLKIKTTDFKQTTRTFTLHEATSSVDILYATAKRLLQHEMDTSCKTLSLRLLGVRMSNLFQGYEVNSTRQITLTQLFSKQNNIKIQSARPNLKVASEEFPEETLQITSNCDNESDSQFLSKKYTNSKSDSSRVHCDKKSIKEEDKVFECPVCTKSIETPSLDVFSRHVNLCLETNGKIKKKNSDVFEEYFIKNRNEQRTDDNNLKCSNVHYLKPGNESQINAHPILSPCEKNDGINLNQFNSYKATNKNKNITITEKENPNCIETPITNICITKDNSNSLNLTKNMIVRNESDDINDNLSSVMGNYSISSNLSKIDSTSSGLNIIEDILCPVCEKISFIDFMKLNEHIDECLNLQAVKNLIEEQPSSHSQPQPQSSSSKRKFQVAGKDSKKSKSCSNTIDRYFSL